MELAFPHRYYFKARTRRMRDNTLGGPKRKKFWSGIVGTCKNLVPRSPLVFFLYRQQFMT